MKQLFIFFLAVLIIFFCAITNKSIADEDEGIFINEGLKKEDITNKELIKDDIKTSTSDTDEEGKAVISEFVLGVGDEIDVKVYRHDDLNKKVRVTPDGINFFPLIGEIRTKGVSVREFKKKIEDAFSAYLVKPQVSLEIIALKGQKVFVLGEVNRPGAYQIDPPTTILEAISNAGGFTLDGKYSSVALIRGVPEKPELKILDLKKALNKGDVSQNVSLKTGDVVYVPRTFISNVDRFFKHFENIIRPIIWTEQGIVVYPRVEDVLTGESGGGGGGVNVIIGGGSGQD